MMAAPIPPEHVTSWWGRIAGRNVAVVAIRLMSVAAGLAYVKVYSGALSADEIGTYFYLSTLSYALNALIFVPVDFYMQARISRLDNLPSDGMRRLVSRVLLVALLACITLSLPLVWLNKLSMIDLPLLYAMASLLYLCTTARGVLNNRGGKVFVSSMLLLESLGRLGAFIGMALMLNASARTLVASSVLALAIELAIILVHARRQLSFSGERGPLDSPRTLLKLATPVSGSAVCNVLQLQTYRVAYPLAGLGATSGIFGVISNIGAAGMAACGSIFSQIHVPHLYQTQGASIRRFVFLASLMATAVLLLALACGPFLVEHLTKPEYVPYAFAIGFGVITEACNVIVGAYTVLLTIQGRAAALLRINLFVTILSLTAFALILYIYPSNPFSIGIPIAGSNLTLVALLGVFIARQKRQKNVAS